MVKQGIDPTKPTEPTPQQSTLFAADIHASHLVTPGSERARQMTAISGRKCIDLLKLSGRDGSLPKMLLATSAWGSTMCWLTWKDRVTPGGRLLFQLAPSMPDTAEIESGSSEPTLWQTPSPAQGNGGQTSRGGDRIGELLLTGQAKMWPTPREQERHQGAEAVKAYAKAGMRQPKTRNGKTRGRGGTYDTTLTTAVVAMWPTASSRDWKDSPGMAKTGTNPDGTERKRNDQLARRVYSEEEQPSGQLNPQFVEWLMGFPKNWTEI